MITQLSQTQEQQLRLMSNLVKIAFVTSASVIGLTVIFLGFDAACLDSGATTCRVLRNFQWESILAGMLGLLGGLFVIYAARAQLQASKEALQEARSQKADELNAPLQMIGDAADSLASWAASKLVEFEKLKKMDREGSIAPNNFAHTVDHWQQELAKRCKHLKEACDTHKTTSLNFKVTEQLELVGLCPELSDLAPIPPEDNHLNPNLFRIKNRLREVKTRATGACEEINRQIVETQIRCKAIG